MDFNYIENYTDGIVIKDVRNFELAHILNVVNVSDGTKQKRILI